MLSALHTLSLLKLNMVICERCHYDIEKLIYKEVEYREALAQTLVYKNLKKLEWQFGKLLNEYRIHIYNIEQLKKDERKKKERQRERK